jgi:TolA-binding protein
MAAAAYVDYLKVTPQGPRASEALIRLAGAFRQLGDNRQRCVALSEFKRRTPRPDATLKARADGEIARMPCPAA